ncbi:MAG: hypothetical protein ACI8X5_000460 [Planctomycetota bacterium]|jgi:hypothetical protein
MLKTKKALRILALFCFCVLLLCAFTSAVTGLLLIWQADREQRDTLWMTCVSTALLTVMTGLVVSGARSMLGVLTDAKDD